ncbi:MAG TPA: hypothetical protein VF316_12480 [Polyangiaceae bacterium]
MTPKPEPAYFDAKVREPGVRWLREHGLPTSGAAPPKTEMSPYWRACLDDLHTAYGGVCAYVCVYIEKVTGARSADHFVAKSSAIDQAYEWTNYRLACSAMNSRKREFDDVLDPFVLADGTFELDLVTGKISPSPHLGSDAKLLAQATIDRLHLDDPECRGLRSTYFTDYLEHHISPQYLERRCPFVWREVRRQNAFRKELATNAPVA